MRRTRQRHNTGRHRPSSEIPQRRAAAVIGRGATLLVLLAAPAALAQTPDSSARPTTIVDSIEALLQEHDALFAADVAPAPVELASISPQPSEELPPGEAAPAVEPAPETASETAEEHVPGGKVAIPACQGGIRAAFSIDAMQPPLAGSAAYRTPDRETLASFTASVQALIENDARLSAEHASLAGYEVCSGTGDEEGVILWRPSIAGDGAPLIALRPAGRPLVVEVPHTLSDEGTVEQGLELFESLGARALIVAGTHRCADPDPSGCDGQTAVCGALQPYRESDMAHNNHSAFQLAHEILAERFSSDLVLSLHGMMADGIVLSDGTTLPTHAGSLIARLNGALAKVFPEEPITVCNAWPGASTTDHLCGTSNVQGRYINGMALDSCTRAASESTGRFLHLEQSRAIRQNVSLVAAALDEVLSAPADAAAAPSD